MLSNDFLNENILQTHIVVNNCWRLKHYIWSYKIFFCKSQLNSMAHLIFWLKIFNFIFVSFSLTPFSSFFSFSSLYIFWLWQSIYYERSEMIQHEAGWLRWERTFSNTHLNSEERFYFKNKSFLLFLNFVWNPAALILSPAPDSWKLWSRRRLFVLETFPIIRSGLPPRNHKQRVRPGGEGGEAKSEWKNDKSKNVEVDYKQDGVGGVERKEIVERWAAHFFQFSNG